MAENNDVSPLEEETSAFGTMVAEKADKIKYILLALLIIIVALAALVSYMRKSAEQREAAAKNKVFETLATVQEGGKPASEAAQAFAQAAKEYSGLDAGAQANLMQFAYTYNENKDYPAAQKAADEFIKTYPRSPMVPRARLAMGQAMLQQDKVDDAITVFRSLTASNDPEILPEAKLALAQALERRAEQAKDNPAEYRTRLEAAEDEYNDIIARSRIPVPSQRGFWPQAVTLPADYALVQLKDRLAGHVHGVPSSMEQGAAAAAGGVMTIPPPPAGTDGAAALTPAGDAVSRAVDAAKDAASSAASAVEHAAGDAAAKAGSAVSGAVDAASRLASEAKDAVAGAAGSVADAAAGASSKVGAAVGGAVDAASRAASSVENAVGAAAGSGVNAASGAASSVENAIGAAARKAGDAADEAMDVFNAANDAAAAASDPGAVTGTLSSTPNTITVEHDVDMGDEEYVPASEATPVP